MATDVTSLATVQEISAHGGPTPNDGETAKSYYARVGTWAASAGYVVGWTSDGYPIITWTQYTPGSSSVAVSHPETTTPVATGTPVTDISQVPIVQAGVGGALIAALPTIGTLLAGLLGGTSIGGLLSGLTGASGSGGTTALTAQQVTAGTTSQIVTGGTTVGGVPFGGIGVPEPPASMVAKTWKTKAFSNTAGEYWVYFWRLLDGRILMWNAAQNEAKIWKPKKPIIGPVYRDKLNLKQYVKMERYLDNVTRTIAKRTKALKLQSAAPAKKSGK